MSRFSLNFMKARIVIKPNATRKPFFMGNGELFKTQGERQVNGLKLSAPTEKCTFSYFLYISILYVVNVLERVFMGCTAKESATFLYVKRGFYRTTGIYLVLEFFLGLTAL